MPLHRVIASGGIKSERSEVLMPERSNPLSVAEIAFSNNGWNATVLSIDYPGLREGVASLRGQNFRFASF